MSKQLVVVESPAKARTISRFLGGNSQVLASMGHVRDLPQRELGVDVQDDFRPSYELTNNGKKVLKALRSAAKDAEAIYLATDPDREGEAIAWHLKQILEESSQAPFYRITFHEITKNAIQNSLLQPGELAVNLVDAQQARRILDRLVGYQVSPLLWRQVGKGTSAGRVQSVALGLIVEREREILAFEPQEYWNFEAMFLCSEPKTKLKTKLSRINAEKALIPDQEWALRLEEALLGEGVRHQVAKVSSSPRRQNAAPPFITSTLQQAAGSHLKLSTSQTMRLAQELYEGVECGGEGSVGLITYMRTDSFNIAAEAQQEAAEYVKKNFGPEYLPAKPNVYRSRKSAQEAHEAIRPTDINRTPDSLSAYLSGPQLRLYRLIWNRFLASQMAAARQLDHVIEIESSGGALATLVWQPDAASKPDSPMPAGTVCTFRAAARQTLFAGYLAVYSMKDLGEEDELDQSGGVLPALKEGQACKLLELLKEQCFTSPPNRYSEASLVKALEQNGVGRPSTYAATIHTILDRDYVNKEKSLLRPSGLGMQVSDFLVQRMPQLFNIGFTAEMEDYLDKIEEGSLDWIEMLRKFNDQLQQWLGAGAMLPESSIAMPDLEQLLLKLFPEDFEFNEPETKGRRVYDDKKFISSICTQISEKGKLSARQWAALFNTLGKYEGEHPHFAEQLQKAGLLEQVRATMKAREKKGEKKTVTVGPALAKLFEQMQKLEWEEPVKRGRRSYDDGKFFASLYKQASQDGLLSEAQTAVLAKLAAKYAKKIPDYAELCAELHWDQPESKAADPQKAAKIEKMLELSEQISSWREPSGKGKRVFDDQEFVKSLRGQYELKADLSERQVAALGKVLGNYTEQIKDFAKYAQELGIMPKQVKQLEGSKCPNCGAALVERMGRGKPFVGCSAFPKCRYIEPRDKGE
ncbi:MAG: type I DNA topoisomerase [Lentisphaerae bacterium]|nr:type I DNA topoisomerase [Lentisphaerota bacterium]